MLQNFNPLTFKKLFVPSRDSHKGQNGKLMIIGGSKLFHGASLWALKVATRIVDMVFYSSVDENLEVARRLRSELFDFIEVPRDRIDDYIQEADAVLIGPGLPRESGRATGEESTKDLTKRLLAKYSQKKWIIDAGSLTEMDPDWLLQLNGNVILTPHEKEFETLKLKVPFEDSQGKKSEKLKATMQKAKLEDQVQVFASEYHCIILLKGSEDIVCPPSRGEAGSPKECVRIAGGNAGMTKGGTGDVLAGLVAALACKNDFFLAASAGSYINKKAGDELFKRVGNYFNASDLADEIPRVMKNLL